MKKAARIACGRHNKKAYITFFYIIISAIINAPPPRIFHSFRRLCIIGLDTLIKAKATPFQMQTYGHKIIPPNSYTKLNIP